MQMLDKRQIHSAWEKSGDLTQSLKEFLPSYKILRNGCQGEMDDEHKEGSCVIWCKITCEQSQTSSWKSPATPDQYHREQRHPIVGRPLQKLLEHILPGSRVHTSSFPTPCIKTARDKLSMWLLPEGAETFISTLLTSSRKLLICV